MIELKETVFETDSENKFATVTTNERKWITKLKKLAENRPSEVQVMLLPEDNYGYMLVRVPKSYMKLSPPKTRVLTDEQKEAAAERMRGIASKRKKNA